MSIVSQQRKARRPGTKSNRTQALERADGGKNFQGLNGGIGGEKNRLKDRRGNGGGRHHFAAGSLRPQRLPNIGVSRTGQQRDYADPARTKLFAKGVSEAKGAVLGGVVGSGAGKHARSRDREIIHDCRAALHHSERGLRDEKRSVEVRLENIFPEGKWKLFHGKIWMGDTGVVDEDVEAFELLAGGAEQSVDRVGIADVARMGEDFDSRRGQFPANAGQRGFAAGGQDQVATFDGQSARDRQSNAASGSGNQSDAAAERCFRP